MADNLEIKYKITAEGGEKVKSQVADIGKTSDESVKGVGKLTTAMRSLGQAVAGLAVLRTVGNLFGFASQQATILEKSFLRLESSAKAFGQSTKQAREAATDLSKNGFATLEQNATALSNLFATGLNVDQSKQFVRAAQDIAAFGNTTGDAAQSVVDLTKGILTNSAEVIENASPALKEINSAYQQNVKDVGKAAAVQQLYADVLKLSTKFTGDAEKLTATYDGTLKRLDATTQELTGAIGKQIQEALRPLLDIVLTLAQSFTEWFTGLSEASQRVLIFGAALVFVAPALISVVQGIAGVAAALKGTALAAAFSLGPISLVIAAILALTAGTIALIEANARRERQRREYNELAELNRLAAATEKTRKEKERLLELEQKYPKETNFLKALRQENLGIIANMNALQEYRDLQNRLTSDSNSEEARRAAAIERQAQQQGQEANRAIIQQRVADAARFQRAIDELSRSITANSGDINLVQQIQREQTQLQRQLDRAEFEANVRRGVNFQNRNPVSNGGFPSFSGGESGNNTPQEIVAEYRRFEATFIEELQNTLEDIEKTFTEETKGIEKSSKKYQDALKKRNLEIANAELQAVNNRLNAVNDTISAIQSGDIGGAVSGVGGVIGGSLGDSIGQAGGIFGAFQGLTDLISGFVSESETATEIAERAYKEAERQTRALEQQIELQKTLVSLQRERDKAEFEGLEIQKRINELTLSPEQARQANLSLVQEQIGTISGTTISAAASGESFEEIRRREIDIRELQTRLSSLSQVPSILDAAAWGNYYNNLQSTIEFARSRPEFAGIAEQLSSGITGGGGTLSQVSSLFRGGFGNVSDPGYIEALYGGAFRRDYIPQLLGLESNIGGTLTSVQGDISDVDTYIGLLEEQKSLLATISDTSTQIADNTDPQKIELRQSRQASIIDVGGRFINSLGQRFISPDVQNAIRSTTAPAAIQSVQLSGAVMDAFQQRIATQMESLLTIQRDARNLLASIAASLDNNSATNPLDVQNTLLTVLQNAKRNGAIL